MVFSPQPKGHCFAEPRLRSFAYGTLMRGMRSHELLAPSVRQHAGPARIGASLIHIDWYPGLVLSDEGSVHGELYELDDVAATFESSTPTRTSRATRARAPSIAVPWSARTRRLATLAWTYIYLGDAGAFPLIPSGRWSGA